MSQLARETDSINLGQGFPDEGCPSVLLDRIGDAFRQPGLHHQYARSRGAPELCQWIAEERDRRFGLRYDPDTEVLVFSGATEGIMSAALGLLNPGDEVILLEPYYDAYPVAAALADASVVPCRLRFPDFRLSPDALRAAVSDRTRMIILNSPHNPTGTVFDDEALSCIADVAEAHDLVVLSDEVYEYLYFDAPHRPIATWPGMRERCLAISSAGKTFNATGWKLGWATGPRHLIDPVQSAHQYVTYASCSALQVGLARGVRALPDDYWEQHRQTFRTQRDALVTALSEAGFEPGVPQGGYFVLADYGALSQAAPHAFAHRLAREARVTAIPPESFYRDRTPSPSTLLRFSFSKPVPVLEAAGERLRHWRSRLT